MSACPKADKLTTVKKHAALVLAPLLAALPSGCALPRVEVPPMPDDRPTVVNDFEDDDPDVRSIDEVGNDPIETQLTPSGSEVPGGADASDEPAGGDLTYLTIDGVLGEINGKAIYAADVLDARQNQLRAAALRRPRDEFRREAASVLMEELQDRMRDKLYLSVFERNLSPAERQQALFLTTLWRQRFITDHGGSQAAARRAARELYDLSLEQLGEDEYGRRLSQIFMQKHIVPRVRPAAGELREAYEVNKKEAPSTFPVVSSSRSSRSAWSPPTNWQSTPP